MLKLLLAVSVALILSGCNSTKTVYPNECAVVSNISVEKADPSWLEEPAEPQKPTEEQLKNGASNADALNLITRNNSELWQRDRDVRRAWTTYYKKLVAEGVIK